MLGPSFAHGHDAVFDEEGDGGGASLLAHADRYEALLQPGECLFVPAGSPHLVRNETHTAALSANFVDASNLELATAELRVAALTNPRAAALLTQLADPEFPRAMDFDAGHRPWSEFKHPPEARRGRN